MSDLYTVQAFRGEQRDERAEQLALKQGFIPAEQERAEQSAKRCNQLGLAGVTFKAVPCEPHEEPEDPQAIEDETSEDETDEDENKEASS